MITNVSANRGRLINQSCAKLQLFSSYQNEVKKHMENKIIDGYERYTINRNGDIFDTKRNKYLATWVDTVGYKQCYLRDQSGKRHSKRIHRLIAKAFIENPNNLPQVNHKDGNKLHNSIDNLEWVTNSDNTQHGYDNNLYKFKSRCHAINVYEKPNHKFFKRYKSIRSMCEELHINRKTVTMILKGEKTTNNYPYEFEYVEESQETIESIA